MDYSSTGKAPDELTMRSFNDLHVFGIHPVGAVADTLSQRVRCDVTQEGKALVAAYLGVTDLSLDAPEMQHPQGLPCVGSLVLDLSIWTALASFAFFHNGALACSETRSPESGRTITGLYSAEKLRAYEAANRPLLRAETLMAA